MEEKRLNGKRVLVRKKDPPLGHKDEEYYSEKELLAGIEDYTWESLSEVEKEFYNNYGNKTHRPNSRNGRKLE